MTDSSRHLVAVVGAGPAGLFAARELACAGVTVAVFNRDIKPGGLAEYGIYPDKHKTKEGLRNQFHQTLAMPGVHYFGNLTIGTHGDLTLADLFTLGFQAVLVTVGAQGTKWLGIPGENLRGVYHAKELVYAYNHLPPYSCMTFEIGRRVAVVGMGNVMMDIARYLIERAQVQEVIGLARRGPAEVKFTTVELQTVVGHLDIEAYRAELERVRPLMLAAGQDPAHSLAMMESALAHVPHISGGSRLILRFLLSPTQILGDAQGKVCGLEVEDNRLVVGEDGEVKARGLGTRHILEVDTVVFAIGDRVDEQFGLPVQGNEYPRNPQPLYPVGGVSYEAFDPSCGKDIEGVFVAGWSRQASTGLVGLARKDGTQGAHAVLQYLAGLPEAPDCSLSALETKLAGLGKPVVRTADLAALEAAEQVRAAALGLEEFKFDTNEEMLEAISGQRSAVSGQ